MQRRVKLKNEKFTKRAFSRVRAGGSLNPGVSYGEVRARAKTLALVSQPFTGETNKEPLFYLSYLEEAIYDLAEGGYIEALKLALREYRDLCRALSRGCQCK